MKFLRGDIVVDQYGQKFRMIGENGAMVPISTDGRNPYDRFKFYASSFPGSDEKAKPEFEIEVPEDLLNDTYPEDIKEMLLDPAVKRGLIKVQAEKNTSEILKRVQAKTGNRPF